MGTYFWLGMANGLIGFIGLRYVGYRRKVGWTLGLIAQIAQVTYGALTGQWELTWNILMVYQYAEHFWRWRHLPWSREHPPTKRTTKKGATHDHRHRRHERRRGHRSDRGAGPGCRGEAVQAGGGDPARGTDGR